VGMRKQTNRKEEEKLTAFVMFRSSSSIQPAQEITHLSESLKFYHFSIIAVVQRDKGVVLTSK
jgi:hypothetical protein